MSVFRKIWRTLFSCNTRFEIRTFALLPTLSYQSQLLKPSIEPFDFSYMLFGPIKLTFTLFICLFLLFSSDIIAQIYAGSDFGFARGNREVYDIFRRIFQVSR